MRKGNQPHFDIEAHIGVDAETKLVHTVIATAANVADVKGAVLAERAPRAEDRICLGWPSNLHVWPEKREANRVKANPLAGGACVRRAELRFGFVKMRYRDEPAPESQPKAGQKT